MRAGRVGTLVTATLVWFVAAAATADGQSTETTTTFGQPGTFEFEVPANVCAVSIQAFGAEGGRGIEGGGVPGLGGGVGATFAVAETETLNIFVGEQGGDANGATGGVGGLSGTTTFGGGSGGTSKGGSDTAVGGGGGGGASFVRGPLMDAGRGGILPRFAIIGGGGGGASFSQGGAGGGLVGQSGGDLNGSGGGGGATEFDVGKGGGTGATRGDNGSYGSVGGAGGPGRGGTRSGGGGGGAGRYGGGGGAGDGNGENVGGRGGGGGSGGLFGPALAADFNLPLNDGDGYVTISYAPDPVGCPSPQAVEPTFTG